MPVTIRLRTLRSPWHRARTRARRPGCRGGGHCGAVFRYGMYGVWYAIGVTETWCSQTSAGPWGIFKVKWL